jgi:hypothetical protein
MHFFGFLLEYWWVIALAMVLFLVSFVLIAGRGAEGGLRGRSREGWRKWRVVAERVANVQARVLLTIFYFTFMAPFGLWQASVADRLGLRRGDRASFWIDRTTRDRDLASGRRQF